MFLCHVNLISAFGLQLEQWIAIYVYFTHTLTACQFSEPVEFRISEIPFKIIFEKKKKKLCGTIQIVHKCDVQAESVREKTDKMPFDNSHSHEEWNCESGNNPENESERLSEREKSHQYRFSLVRDRQYNCFFKLFFIRVFSFSLALSLLLRLRLLRLLHVSNWCCSILDSINWIVYFGRKTEGLHDFILSNESESNEMWCGTEGQRDGSKNERKENDTSSMENKYLF